METPLHRYMKVGLVHFMAFPVGSGEGPVLESLKQVICDDYFEVLEISWIKDKLIRERAKQLLASSGMTAVYGAHPRILSKKLDLNAFDEEVRIQSIDEMKQAIDDAADFGIRDFAFLSGSYPGDELRGKAMDLLEDSICQLCVYADDKNMNLVLEVFDQAVDKKCLIGRAHDAREIAERVRKRHRNFGLLVDLSHAPLLGETPAQALRPVTDFLVHAHIGNCYLGDKQDPAFGDKHPRFGYPGGINDVDEIVEFLKELFYIGYLRHNSSQRPIVSFEVKPLEGEDPAVIIANSKRKLNEAWAKLVL